MKLLILLTPQRILLDPKLQYYYPKILVILESLECSIHKINNKRQCHEFQRENACKFCLLTNLSSKIFYKDA